MYIKFVTITEKLLMKTLYQNIFCCFTNFGLRRRHANVLNLCQRFFCAQKTWIKKLRRRVILCQFVRLQTIFFYLSCGNFCRALPGQYVIEWVIFAEPFLKLRLRTTHLPDFWYDKRYWQYRLLYQKSIFKFEKIK